MQLAADSKRGGGERNPPPGLACMAPGCAPPPPSLAAGVRINLDNWQELERVEGLLEQHPEWLRGGQQLIGLRINPQVRMQVPAAWPLVLHAWAILLPLAVPPIACSTTPLCPAGATGCGGLSHAQIAVAAPPACHHAPTPCWSPPLVCRSAQAPLLRCPRGERSANSVRCWCSTPAAHARPHAQHRSRQLDRCHRQLACPRARPQLPARLLARSLARPPPAWRSGGSHTARAAVQLSPGVCCMAQRWQPHRPGRSAASTGRPLHALRPTTLQDSPCWKTGSSWWRPSCATPGSTCCTCMWAARAWLPRWWWMALSACGSCCSESTQQARPPLPPGLLAQRQGSRGRAATSSRSGCWTLGAA